MVDRRYCAAPCSVTRELRLWPVRLFVLRRIHGLLGVLSHSFNFWIAEAIDKMVVNDAVGLHQRIASGGPTNRHPSCFSALLICSDSLLACICFSCRTGRFSVGSKDQRKLASDPCCSMVAKAALALLTVADLAVMPNNACVAK